MPQMTDAVTDAMAAADVAAKQVETAKDKLTKAETKAAAAVKRAEDAAKLARDAEIEKQRAEAHERAMKADLRCTCGSRALVQFCKVGPDGHVSNSLDGQQAFYCFGCTRVHTLDTTTSPARLKTIISTGHLPSLRQL